VVSAGFATGLDLVEVARFDRLLARTPGFAERYFTPGERQRCGESRRPGEAFAICFAVKEALLKALGLGVLGPIGLVEIEVEPARGPAILRLTGPAAAAVGPRRAWASTACDGAFAWAVVVLD
jgi:holo-[acyl-carrier protein] synthase